MAGRSSATDRAAPRMQLAQPPGVRSCYRDTHLRTPGDGGEWEYCRNANGGTSLIHELHDLTSWMTRTDRNAFLAELADRYEQAESGRLVFGEGKLSDVSKMGSAEVVLEIRLRTMPRGARSVKQHIRVYFTEPAHQDRVLLLLHIASKRPDAFGLAEQNKHIQVAQGRADTHYRRAPLG